MKRSRRPSGILRALSVGLGLPVLLLFALFSLMPYQVMTGTWPLGIDRNEVEFYQRFFDRRPGQHTEDHAERYDLDSTGMCAEGPDNEWHWRRFSAKGFADSVRVRALDGGTHGWVLSFPETRLFRGQRTVNLTPVTLGSIRARFEQLVATEQGLLAPEIGFVRLYACGRDMGVFTKEEGIGPEFLKKHGALQATLLGEPSPLGGTFAQAQQRAEERTMQATLSGDGSRMDSSSATTMALLRCTRPPGAPWEPMAAFDRSRGSLLPLHRMSASGREDAAESGRLFTTDSCFSTPLSHQRVRRLAADLRADSAAWVDRFTAVEALWAPALAEGMSIGYVRARLASERLSFLQALFHPEPEEVFGTRASMTGPTTEPLRVEVDPWLKPYVRGDSVRFERGSYTLDHEVVVPEGMSVVIGKGARFFLAAGAGLLVNGPLHVNGTAINPVFVRAAEGAAPYGAIAVHGNGRTPCVLRGLRMSGGQGAWLADRYHSAMLSFHDCHVTMENCVIDGEGSGDAMNAERCEVFLTRCTFESPRSETVALGLTKGEVNACDFHGRTGPDSLANGIGLAIRASHILVAECRFEVFRGKALSVSNTSQVLVREGVFKGNGTAMAVTDLSVAHADGCDLQDNGTAFRVYRETPVFGGGYLTFSNSTFEGNLHERSVDGSSTVLSVSGIDDRMRQAFGAK